MSSDIGDRLGLLRESCVSKYDRLDEITWKLREGERVIEETKKNFPIQSKICNLRVQLAEKQSSHALIVEEIEDEMQKHQNLRDKINQLKDDLEVHMGRYKVMSEKASYERRVLDAHYELGMDNLNLFYEQYLMSNEELDTLIHLVKDVEQKDRSTVRIEWLKKIIRATQIQQKEDESSLTHLENEHSKILTNNVAQGRKQ